MATTVKKAKAWYDVYITRVSIYRVQARNADAAVDKCLSGAEPEDDMITLSHTVEKVKT